jgi:uncharacterized protein (TIGR00369 family)
MTGSILIQVSSETAMSAPLTAMNSPSDALGRFRAFSATAPFNLWMGLEPISIAEGDVEIKIAKRVEMAQYSGFLHAGVVGAMIDTACGFAAATIAGPVIASHYSVSFLAPAVGESFVARGRVVKAGKRQVFARAELFAETTGSRKLVAVGDTLLLVQRE